MRAVVIDVLLGLGLVIELLSVVGVIVMPHVYDRLHFLAPAAVGSAFIAAAIVVRESLDHQGIVAMLVMAFLLVFGAVLTHSTARTARARQHGDWRPGPRETVHRSGEP